MPRLSRVVLPNHPHHVTQRGVRSQTVFFEDDDRWLYLDLMRRQAERHGVQVLCYCLMTNHVHLPVMPTSSQSLMRATGVSNPQCVAYG